MPLLAPCHFNKYESLSDRFEVREEQRGLGVGGHQEAGARRDREVHDSGAVHQAAALELLAEQTLAPAREPALHLLRRVLPGVGQHCETVGLARRKAAAEHAVGEEVLQAVGADGLLALLLDHVVVDRQQLGRHRAVEHVVERGLELFILGGRSDIADVCAHLRLRDTEVDVIVGRVVTVVGAPAVDELAEILGADVETVDLVGQVISTWVRSRAWAFSKATE